MVMRRRGVLQGIGAVLALLPIGRLAFGREEPQSVLREMDIGEGYKVMVEPVDPAKPDEVFVIREVIAPPGKPVIWRPGDKIMLNVKWEGLYQYAAP